MCYELAEQIHKTYTETAKQFEEEGPGSGSEQNLGLVGRWQEKCVDIIGMPASSATNHNENGTFTRNS